MGATGLVGIIITLISPLAVAPVITLVGLALFKPAIREAGTNYIISIFTFFLIVLFSQYLRSVDGKFEILTEVFSIADFFENRH